MTLNSIISWNVNGIRSIAKKGFQEKIQEINPNVLCLQETKAQKEDIKNILTLFPDYHHYVNSSKGRKGYSGTAVLSKMKPLHISYDMDNPEHDQEGRIISAEYDDFILVNVYVPNSGRGLARLDYRKKWDKDFLKYLKKLEKNKPLVVGGDFNVAHQEIDLARPKQNYNKTAGYTRDEIDGFQKFLDSGLVDSFREENPDRIAYTYWNYMFNARARNVGWRIDYFLVSKSIHSHVKQTDILGSYKGSDHCPIRIDLEF